MVKSISRFILLFTAIAFSQPAREADNQLYSVTALDVKPEFPGGTKMLNEYLIKSGIKTDPDSKSSVFAMFVVEKDGSLTDVQILGKTKPANSALLEKAIRELPEWKAGKMNGQVVRVKYVLPLILTN